MTNVQDAPKAGILVVLPALVDHPGLIAWGDAIELAGVVNVSTFHVLYLAGCVAGDDDMARDRLLTASHRALQQWALARTIGEPLAEDTHLHAATTDDAESAVRTLVARGGIDRVVVASCAETRSMIAGLAGSPPCSLSIITSGRTARDEPKETPRIHSAPLATPAPLPTPPVVTDAVG